MFPIATRGTLWISGAIAAVLFVWMAIYLRSLGGLGILRLQFTFSESGFRRAVEKWSPQTLARFKTALIIDVAFLCAYAVFGYTLGARTCADATTPLARIAPWLPPAAALADLGEDVLQHRLLRDPSAHLPGIAYALAGACALTKWVLIVVFVLVAMRCCQ